MINLPPKTKKWLSLAGKTFVVIVAVGLLVWFFIINPYLTRQEKQRFESASSELKNISQEIQSSIGAANTELKNNSCDRPNLKLEKGPLSCDVGYELEYTESNALSATSMVQQTEKVSDAPLRIGSGGMESLKYTEGMGRQVIYQDIESLNGLSCFIAYSYHQELLNILVSCGGPARAEHYPVED